MFLLLCENAAAMTPREQMYQIIYKAMGDGLAKLIRNGLAFTVMAGAIIGLSFALYYAIMDGRVQIKEIKSEVATMKAEWAAERNDLRREIAACDLERRTMAIRVAELSVLVNRNISKR